jgi:hypothetical protein
MDPLQPGHGKPLRGGHEAYLATERFLKASPQPALMEPGEDPLPIAADTFALQCNGQTVILETNRDADRCRPAALDSWRRWHEGYVAPPWPQACVRAFRDEGSPYTRNLGRIATASKVASGWFGPNHQKYHGLVICV